VSGCAESSTALSSAQGLGLTLTSFQILISTFAYTILNSIPIHSRILHSFFVLDSFRQVRSYLFKFENITPEKPLASASESIFICSTVFLLFDLLHSHAQFQIHNHFLIPKLM